MIAGLNNTERFLCHEDFASLVRVFQQNQDVERDIRLGAPTDDCVFVVCGVTCEQKQALDDVTFLLQAGSNIRPNLAQYGRGVDRSVDYKMTELIETLVERRDVMKEVFDHHKDWQASALEKKEAGIVVWEGEERLQHMDRSVMTQAQTQTQCAAQHCNVLSPEQSVCGEEMLVDNGDEVMGVLMGEDSTTNESVDASEWFALAKALQVTTEPEAKQTVEGFMESPVLERTCSWEQDLIGCAF